MFSTLFVLAVGAGMASLYLQPEKPSASERIKAESILPTDVLNQAPPADAAAQPALFTSIESSAPPPSAPATAPMVALPSGPLLRSATEAPPIDTSSSLDPAVPVRHDPDSSPGLSGRIGSLAGPQADALEVQPSSTRRSRSANTRRVRSQSRTAHSTKKIEQLFLNPLGVR